MRHEHVDVVVVGSGFGGSVTAYRLAAEGLSVAVLERGRGYPPGSFPRRPAEMSTAFWGPAEQLYGLYDVGGFDGCDSGAAGGAGGGPPVFPHGVLRQEEDRVRG